MGEDVAKEVVKAVAKEAYEDAAKPVVKPTGELASLVPRAVKAALQPLELWIMQKEYNIERTRLLLEKKLKDVPPEHIVPPEAHIAVPALQYISYCMDNEELRNMYANLLAQSMNVITKTGVHPSFVEIIKQMCPDEAKILRYMSSNKTVPIISLRHENKSGEGYYIIDNFSNIGELAGCDNPLEINMYFTNLIRLGLLLKAPSLSSLVDKSLYTPLKEHPYVQQQVERCKQREDEYCNPRLV